MSSKDVVQTKTVNLIANKEFKEEIIDNALQFEKFDAVATFEGWRICLNYLIKFK